MNDFLLAYVAMMQVQKNMKDELGFKTKETKTKKIRK